MGPLASPEQVITAVSEGRPNLPGIQEALAGQDYRKRLFDALRATRQAKLHAFFAAATSAPAEIRAAAEEFLGK